MATMNEIQEQAKVYADARKDLAAKVTKLQRLKDRIQKRYTPGITKALLILIEAKQMLRNMINASRALFQSPKTQIFSDVKVGYQKGKGKITWEKKDEGAIIARIRKYHKDIADQLIITKEHPSKEGLEKLTVKQLERLGIAVQEAGDHVVVKDMDNEIEKLVKTLLKSEEEEQAEAA